MALKITSDLVRHLAALARLDLNQSEIEKFKEDLESILGYLGKIQQLDTSKVRPFPDTLEQPARLRPDVTEKFADNALLFPGGRLKNNLLSTRSIFNRDDDK